MAGIKYNMPPEVERELWNQKTSYRLAGGFNLDVTNLSEGSDLPVLCPLKIDFKKRTATVVRNVKVVEKSATKTVKVAKGSLAYVGMLISDGENEGTITAINKSNAAYDTLTLKDAPAAELKAEAVLFEIEKEGEKEPKNSANFLNFALTKIEQGATVTALGQAYEIKEDLLYVPVSEKDKETLGARFMFT